MLYSRVDNYVINTYFLYACLIVSFVQFTGISYTSYGFLADNMSTTDAIYHIFLIYTCLYGEIVVLIHALWKEHLLWFFRM